LAQAKKLAIEGSAGRKQSRRVEVFLSLLELGFTRRFEN
jgi:hypothetical protein